MTRSIKRRFSRIQLRDTRIATGQSLVEALIACLIGATVCLALGGQMSNMMRFSTQSQHHVIVTDIAQQIIDNLRNSRYATLLTYCSATPYALLLNKTSSSSTGPAFLPRAMLLDQVVNSYQSQSLNGAFQNALTSATVTLTSQNAGNEILASVRVTWLESGKTKSYTTSTLIAENGIHQ